MKDYFCATQLWDLGPQREEEMQKESNFTAQEWGFQSEDKESIFPILPYCN